MIVPINLERLSGDGYKMNANSPTASTPSYITHAQLRYTPFTSSEAIQGTFVTGALSTVEFSVTGGNLTRLLKLYTSTDGTTYTENKSWGGTNGVQLKDYLTYSAHYTIGIMGVLTTTEITDEIGLSAPSLTAFNTKITYTIVEDSLPLNKTNFIPSCIGNGEENPTLKNININYSVSGTTLELRAVDNSDGSAYDLSQNNGTAFTFTIQKYP